MMGVRRYSWGVVKMFCSYQCGCVQIPILQCVMANNFSCAPALFDCDYDMDHVSEINVTMIWTMCLKEIKHYDCLLESSTKKCATSQVTCFALLH